MWIKNIYYGWWLWKNECLRISLALHTYVFYFLFNWLLFNISNYFFFHFLQVQDLAERMIKWLKVGGYIFFRETCFHQSGDHKGKNNPTHYREPRFYTKVILKSVLFIHTQKLTHEWLELYINSMCSVIFSFLISLNYLILLFDYLLLLILT